MRGIILKQACHAIDTLKLYVYCCRNSSFCVQVIWNDDIKLELLELSGSGCQQVLYKAWMNTFFVFFC